MQGCFKNMSQKGKIIQIEGERVCFISYLEVNTKYKKTYAKKKS